MRKAGKFLLAVLLAVNFPCSLYAQCSDAGVCAIGSEHTGAAHSVGVGYLFGASGKPDEISYHAVQFEGALQLFPGSRLTLLLPWHLQISGPLGSNSGVGDLIVLWNQRVWGEPGEGVSVQIGAKLASGASAAGGLPQAYQPGLGTNDLLLGATYEAKSWTFAAGYQLSRGRSDNPVDRLKRGDDLLGRVGYRLPLGVLLAGLEVLAIQRLQRSSILDRTVTETEAFVDVPGSDRLQVNLLGTAELPIGQAYALRALVALPLRNRPVNIDGLKRSLSLALGMQHTF